MFTEPLADAQDPMAYSGMLWYGKCLVAMFLLAMIVGMARLVYRRR